MAYLALKPAAIDQFSAKITTPQCINIDHVKGLVAPFRNVKKGYAMVSINIGIILKVHAQGTPL